MEEYIDRRQVRGEARNILQNAQVSPKKFFALYFALILGLNLIDSLANGNADAKSLLANPLGIFVMILTSLVSLILGFGCYVFCFGVRRGTHMEFLSLFDGFSMAGKVILLYLVEWFFVTLWMLLLVVPGIIAMYRYRYAILNLCENPSLGVMDALNLSKRQTYGYKGQLFMLDLSFLGWALLAGLPTIYFESCAISGTASVLTGLAGADLLETLICGVWTLAVGIFYWGLYLSMEIGYFTISKRTSGTDQAALPENDGNQGTDPF